MSVCIYFIGMGTQYSVIGTCVFCLQKPVNNVDHFSDLALSGDHDSDVFKEQFVMRFLVRCEGFKLRLQANVAEDGQPERLDNVSCLDCLIKISKLFRLLP